MQECFIFLLDCSIKLSGGAMAVERASSDATSQLLDALCGGPLHAALTAPKPEVADTGARIVAGVLGTKADGETLYRSFLRVLGLCVILSPSQLAHRNAGQHLVRTQTASRRDSMRL